MDEERIIRGMVGRALGTRFPERPPIIGAPFFEVRDWQVRHPQILAAAGPMPTTSARISTSIWTGSDNALVIGAKVTIHF